MLTVVIIIGILSALAYSGLMDLIASNRAKEAAYTMETFAERALAEGRRQNKPVTITLIDNSMTARTSGENSEVIAEEYLSGFRAEPSPSPAPSGGANYNQGKTSDIRIGLSGIADSGYFVACGARGYCGAAVKKNNRNFFWAHVKKGVNSGWEAL